MSATLGQFQSTLDRQLVENVVISGAFNTIGVYKDVSEEQRKKAADLMEEFKISYLEGHKFSTLSVGEHVVSYWLVPSWQILIYSYLMNLALVLIYRLVSSF